MEHTAGRDLAGCFASKLPGTPGVLRSIVFVCVWTVLDSEDSEDLEALANISRLGPELPDIGMFTETMVESPLSQSRAFSLGSHVKRVAYPVLEMHGTHEASRAFR